MGRRKKVKEDGVSLKTPWPLVWLSIAIVSNPLKTKMPITNHSYHLARRASQQGENSVNATIGRLACYW